MVMQAVLVGAILLWAPAPKERKPIELTDAELIKRVREAVAKKATPALVEKMVGTEATIISTRAPDRYSLSRADIFPDGELEWVKNVKKYPVMIYWVRPVKSRECKIVGIVWDEKGNPRLFFGIVDSRG
jgi:hypothetical protein